MYMGENYSAKLILNLKGCYKINIYNKKSLEKVNVVSKSRASLKGISIITTTLRNTKRSINQQVEPCGLSE